MEIEVKPAAPQLRLPENFANTRWSIVAGMQSENKGDARRSLVELCQAYWYPVFAYVRRCGHAPEIAYDLCQSFFEYLLEELRVANPQEYGQFRAFLLARLNRFLAEDWRNERVARNAPEVSPVEPLLVMEERQKRELAVGATPERAFQKSFALEVLTRSLNRLRLEAQQGGRLAMFEQLEPYLTTEPEAGQYDVLAQALGTRALAVVVAIKRLRQRFRELVDEELQQTVATDADMDAERGALLAILGDGS